MRNLFPALNPMNCHCGAGVLMPLTYRTMNFPVAGQSLHGGDAVSQERLHFFICRVLHTVPDLEVPREGQAEHLGLGREDELQERQGQQRRA